MSTARTSILIDADLLDRLDRHVRRERTTKTAVIAADGQRLLEEARSAGLAATVWPSLWWARRKAIATYDTELSSFSPGISAEA